MPRRAKECLPFHRVSVAVQPSHQGEGRSVVMWVFMALGRWLSYITYSHTHTFTQYPSNLLNITRQLQSLAHLSLASTQQNGIYPDNI